MTLRMPLAALVAAGVAFAPAAAFAAPQKTTCDAYSHKCTHVLGDKITKPAVQADNSVLPFTGAEVVGMTLVGGAAVGGGAVLVVAGRRRRRGVATA